MVGCRRWGQENGTSRERSSPIDPPAPRSTDIAGTVTALIFAFATGIAGTFTACNVAVFSAMAPMVENKPLATSRIAQALRPLGWLTLGAVVVARTYGAIGALLGSGLPQLSTATVGVNHMPVRLLQSRSGFGYPAGPTRSRAPTLAPC